MQNDLEKPTEGCEDTKDQLEGVKIQKTKNIQSYFSRVSHIKEHLEAIGDMVEEEDMAMTTLMVSLENGIPSL